MSSGSYLQVYVRCPFYLTDNGKDSIGCEGLLAGANIRNYFRRNSDFLNQMNVFCCGNYEDCPLHQALMLKYED